MMYVISIKGDYWLNPKYFIKYDGGLISTPNPKMASKFCIGASTCNNPILVAGALKLLRPGFKTDVIPFKY